MELPKELKTEKDLADIFLYFCSSGSVNTHLRFGQFIFNVYYIEWKNSYNEKDSSKAYSLILELILNLQAYFLIKNAIEKGQRVLPQERNDNV